MRVHGVGPAPSSLFLVGEAPGIEEEKLGRPFVGKSGRELDRLLLANRLPSRDDLFITNIVRERPTTKAGQNREPTKEEIDRDIADLALELLIVEPTCIVTLGRTATRWFLGDVDMETVHGIAHQAGPYWIFPTYHPAAALHSPEMQAVLAYDFQRLGAFVRGQLPARTVDTAGKEEYAEDGNPILIQEDWIAIDTEGWEADPWCLSYSQQPYEGRVIRGDDACGLFAAQIEEHTGPIVLHNSLHDLSVLRGLGIHLPHFTDTMILAYLLGLEPQGLKPLAYRHAGMVQQSYEDIIRPGQERIERAWLEAAPLPDKVKKRGRKSKVELRVWWGNQSDETKALVSTPFPEATLDDIDPDVAIRYAARDADATLRIYPILQQQIEAMGLSEVAEVDCAIVPMIDRMQQIGIKADLDHFRDLGVLLDLRLATLRSMIAGYAGEELNPGSPQQVEALLFTRFRLPKGKRTKSGEHFSTADAQLEAIRELHPIVGLILDWREAAKLKGTYVDPMPGYIHADGRLHPRFRITRVASGRLAASEPNVLAFPKHSELGKLVRMGFLADEGHELGEWDLDQIEMRVMAHDSGDQLMIEEFHSGIDKHTATAARLFGKHTHDVRKEERFAAKAVNFGILMGMTAVGLTAQFQKNGQRQWQQRDCQQLLDEYFKTYPGVRRYVSEKHAEARRFGYVRDMWGRIRYLAGVHSSDKRIAEEALRQAQATPIQSGAQGIIKRIMRALWPEIVKLRRDHWVEPLLQVHDALMFEHDKAVRTLLDETVMSAMRHTVTLRIPVTAKGSTAERWGDL